MIRKLLIAVDDSDAGMRAAEFGVALGTQLDADMTMLHVIDTAAAISRVSVVGHVNQAMIDRARTAGKRLLDRIVKHVAPTVPVQKVIADGDAAENIVDVVKESGADALVVGVDKRSRFSHLVLGSVADEVVKKSACPVITVNANSVAVPKKRTRRLAKSGV